MSKINLVPGFFLDSGTDVKEKHFKTTYETIKIFIEGPGPASFAGGIAAAGATL